MQKASESIPVKLVETKVSMYYLHFFSIEKRAGGLTASIRRARYFETVTSYDKKTGIHIFRKLTQRAEIIEEVTKYINS